MTIKELESQLRTLCLEGKGHYPIYFKTGSVSYPILDLTKGDLVGQEVVMLLNEDYKVGGTD